MARSSVQIVFLLSVILAAHARPGNCPDGTPWNTNVGVDENGCTVDWCSKVCPHGVETSDGRKVTYAGTFGPGHTGSTGNAGPLSGAPGSANRVAVDPAALSLIKQQERYTKWAEQQIKNAEKQLGTAGK